MSTELIKALQNPTLYDHATEGFKVLETHISWIILTGPYAYKIKKPVNFGFLDFSTLDKRKHFCHEELRLNRRLAPSLYLDVVPIFGTATSPCLADKAMQSSITSSTKPLIEYALKMVQFPQQGLLDQLEQKQQLTAEHIQQLATSLAHFHQSIAVADTTSTFGTPPAVINPARQNFEQIQLRLGEPALREELARIQAWTETTFQRLRPVIEQRKANGYVRECHGDLHLGNITEFNQELVIFDCIEFNPGLSWIDVISDLAFLTMDLEKRQQFAYANQLVNQYLSITGDYPGLALLDFYKAYRAMVRAKVALLSLSRPGDSNGGSHEENDTLMSQYRQYTALADRYEAIPNRYILLMHGYSGSGKSVISEQLTRQLGAIRIRTDVERKRLYHYQANQPTNSPQNSGIYTEEATQKTYAQVANLTASVLESGLPVVVDATHLKQWQRQLFLQQAEQHAVPLLIISCEATNTELKKRIVARAKRQQDASEADITILEKQQLTAEPLSDQELRYTMRVNSSQPDQLALLIENIKHHLALE